MGKLAAALGIGVKGSIAISLERPTYRPGETLIGQITLRIHETFDTKELVVTINGEEQLTWETTQYESLNQHHKRTRALLQEQQLFATPQRYDPGDYVFPFEFTLPEDLPTYFEYWKPRMGELESIHARVTYNINVSLPVLGAFKSDLSSNQRIRIVAPTGAEPQSLQARDRKEVSVLGVFGKGHCTITASLATNLLRQKEEASVHCTIENDSKKRVKHVRTELMQLVELLPSEDNKSVLPRSKTRMVNRTDYFSVDAGQTKSVVLQPAMVDTKRIAYLLPSFRSEFIRISYQLVVHCKYSMSEGPSVSFPLTLVHHEA
ncbi:hypothetical protein Poli38472_014630 [Pythium oligandrum]|uniref:Arrestin C-terminal-like domain-containing protein n=1 Tax=Pythium oligandrum TaxID=41045 RepID=A0A8K1CIN3_PYTOL|nr:hypothetical protein Poli38472_014630 [Pythium oligandrum]|eukprot:TMW63925.1 hypothetical protein Poli38472_014630 [Pythium oligandrum]